jgi:hypothetical protein
LNDNNKYLVGSGFVPEENAFLEELFFARLENFIGGLGREASLADFNEDVLPFSNIPSFPIKDASESNLVATR